MAPEAPSAVDVLQPAASAPFEGAHAAKPAERAAHAAISSNGPTPVRPVKRHQSRAPMFIGVLMGILLAMAVYLAWDQWFGHDDAADIQGTWQIEGSYSAIVVDADKIYLGDSVIYGYRIDTFSKTLTIDFYGREGTSNYEFSDDRTQITLTDDNPLPDGRGAPDEVTGAVTITLYKVSDDTDPDNVGTLDEGNRDEQGDQGEDGDSGDSQG